MKKIVKVALLVIAVLTVIYACVVAYAYANSSRYGTDLSGYGKDPIEYGIWRHYLAERVKTEPQEWNTTEELGIVLVKSKVIEGRFHIYIADEEKALPWMKDHELTPYAVKYEGDFYRIYFVWVTPGLSESAKGKLVAGACGLGCGWLFAGGLFLTERKKKE